MEKGDKFIFKHNKGRIPEMMVTYDQPMVGGMLHLVKRDSDGAMLMATHYELKRVTEDSEESQGDSSQEG